MSNKKIIGILRPFDKKQCFQVYEDGNALETKYTTIDDLEATIYELCEKYSVTEVDLTGPKQYNRGLKKKFETKYSNSNKININIV